MNKFRAVSFFFNTIRVGYLNQAKYTYHKYSSLNYEIAKKLLELNLIVGYYVDRTRFSIRIHLRYHNSRPIILSHVVYKPSTKWVSSFKDVLPYYDKFDIFVISGSEGLITSKEHFDLHKLQMNRGGYVLFGLNILVSFIKRY